MLVGGEVPKSAAADTRKAVLFSTVGCSSPRELTELGWALSSGRRLFGFHDRVRKPGKGSARDMPAGDALSRERVLLSLLATGLVSMLAMPLSACQRFRLVLTWRYKKHFLCFRVTVLY